MNSTEKERIVKHNLHIFMMRDALAKQMLKNNQITDRTAAAPKMETNLERGEPDLQNDSEHPFKPQLPRELKPKTFLFLEAILKCQGLEIKTIPDSSQN
uniref:Uncharacterized protein n=1 Tax=Pithovirus LCPAC201 TaxID=2506591 RepID=A0A481Z6D1_9VIRU|nr:MAG: hypothetical protein LCPAC201_02530 [Pithovirus LCPAC201]